MINTRTDWSCTFIELQAEKELVCKSREEAVELKDSLLDAVEALNTFIDKIK